MPNKYNDNWSMSEERVHTENLLCQRINFLLLFYTIVISGALLIINNFPYLQIILLLGSIITLLISITIRRVQIKLNIILEELNNTPDHPVSIINNKAKGRSVKNIIGFVIPSICWSSLTIGFIFSVFYWINP